MDRREAVLVAAEALFAQLGYDNTNMKAVAGQAGVAVGLAYNYFPSKEAVLAAVLQRGLDDIAATLATLQLAPDANPQTRLVGYLQHVFLTVRQHRNRWLLLHQLRLHPALRHLLATPAMQTFRAGIAEQLQQVLPPGASPAAALALFAAVDGAVLHDLESGGVAAPDALINELANRFSNSST